MAALANLKHELFCMEYLADANLNAAKAARNAGYSVKRARKTGSELLARDDIQRRLSELRQERIERLRIDADYVLLRLFEQDQLNIADILFSDGAIKPISEWTNAWQVGINKIEIIEYFEGKGKDREHVGYVKRISIPDRARIIELLGKHVSVGALSTVVEKRSKYEDMSDEEIRRKISEYTNNLVQSKKTII